MGLAANVCVPLVYRVAEVGLTVSEYNPGSMVMDIGVLMILIPPRVALRKSITSPDVFPAVKRMGVALEEFSVPKLLVSDHE
jgi:hypothetical protein